MTKGTMGYRMSPTAAIYPDRYRLIPAVTGVPAVGVVLTSGAGAWGAYKDIAALNAIASEFLICGFYLDTVDAVQIFEVQVSDGVPTPITEFRVNPTAITLNMGFFPVGLFPVYQAANTQIQARCGGAAAKVIGVSMLYTIG